MAPNTEIDNPVMTTGEVYRMAKGIKESLDAVTRKLDEYPNMRDIANLENQVRNNKTATDARIHELEISFKWSSRAAIVALGGVVLNIIVETSRIVP